MRISFIALVFLATTYISLGTWAMDHQKDHTNNSFFSNIWASLGSENPVISENERWEAGLVVLLFGAYIAFGPHSDPAE